MKFLITELITTEYISHEAHVMMDKSRNQLNMKFVINIYLKISFMTKTIKVLTKEYLTLDCIVMYIDIKHDMLIT